ncbi:MAG: NAD-binding protein [Pirellulales bacterium]|nr:NAD-binding protein [Pirellulales bacterium]
MKSSIEIIQQRSRRFRRSRIWQWIAIAALGAAALVLGCAGFAKSAAAAGEAVSWVSVVYRTLQLFVMEFNSTAGPLPWELDVARFLAPIVPAWAVIQAGLVVFGQQLEAFNLRRNRRHVVVCGLGRKGTQLVKDFRRCGERVVAMERNEGNPAIDVCREMGALVLVGDAREAALLAKARVDRARCVLAVTGDDGVNVAVALHCHQLSAGGSKTVCFVHLVDLKLCTLLRQHPAFTQTDDALEVRIFNAYEAAARMLVAGHPPDRGQITASDPRSVHLVLIGFGQMGEGVLLQVAKTAHYANGRRLQATVVDSAADEKRRGFSGRYPQFDKVADFAFIHDDAEGPEVLQRIEQLAADPGQLTTVAICLDSDSRSLSCALALSARLARNPVPVLVRMCDESGLVSLLKHPARSEPHAVPIEPFGATSRSCTRQLLLDENLDTLARAIHTRFVERRGLEGRDSDDPAMQKWDRLMEDFKESNRQQADHIPVKLRAIGCRIAPIGSPGAALEAFTEEEVDLLAHMEHARWCAERHLAGWSYAPGERDMIGKTHPYLCPWDQLTATVQDYDREAVRDIPFVLARIGQAVYRTAPYPDPTAPAPITA